MAKPVENEISGSQKMLNERLLSQVVRRRQERESGYPVALSVITNKEFEGLLIYDKLIEVFERANKRDTRMLLERQAAFSQALLTVKR